MKQYLGGHNETWGGVTINIDSNFLDLGAGSVAVPEGRCPGTRLGYWKYPDALPRRRAADAGQGAAVPADRAGHLLRPGQRRVRRRHDRRRPRLAGRPQVHPDRHLRDAALDGAAVRRSAYDDQARARSTSRSTGCSGRSTRPGAGRFRASGVFDAKTEAALRAYQSRLRIAVSGVATPQTWNKLQQGT